MIGGAERVKRRLGDLFSKKILQFLHECRSGRQGCNPAAESPAISVARLPANASAQARRAGVGYVVILHLGESNQSSYAWGTP